LSFGSRPCDTAPVVLLSHRPITFPAGISDTVTQ
jgi:hypothetical protein